MNREKDFKKGIKDKTRQRDDQQLSIRKNKRQEKLIERRQYDVDNFEGYTFEALVNMFNPALISQRNVTSLRQLSQMIYLANEFQLEQVILKNILPHLPLLVRFCESFEHADQPIVIAAITCLVNLTSKKLHHDVLVAKTIFDAGFIHRTVPALVSRHHEGTNGCMNLEIRTKLWDTVANLGLTCIEARDTIMNSPLMPAILAHEFQHLYDQNDGETMRLLLPILICLNRVMTQYKCDTPYIYLFAIWPHLIRTWMELQPQPLVDVHPRIQAMTHHVLDSIHCTLVLQQGHDEQQGTKHMKRMMLMTHCLFFSKLREMYPLVSRHCQLVILEIINRVSAIELNQGGFQDLMDHSGCVGLVLQAATNNSEYQRMQAFLIIGNFMSDGVMYVRKMIQGGAVALIMDSIRLERNADVRERATWAFLTMFETCDDYRKKDISQRDEAENIMRSLVNEYNMFRYILPLLTKVGMDEQLVISVLKILCTALEWDYELTCHKVQANAADQITILLDRLNSLKGSQVTNLFRLASRVDDLLHHRQEEETIIMEPSAPGFDANGVWHGAFSF
jgi:hypothetical protein